MAQGLSTPDPSLSPTHLSIRRGRATTTHYTQRSRNTTLVPSLGLRIGPACKALKGRPQRWHAKGTCVTPNKKEKRKNTLYNKNLAIANRSRVSCAHNMSRASMITP